MNDDQRQVTIRGSSADRFMQCAHSIDEPEVSIHESGDAANLGSAVHEGNARSIEGKELNIELHAEMWSVKDIDVMQKYINFSMKGWRESISQYFPNPSIEQPLQFPLYSDDGLQITLSGTLDIASYINGTILDWKTGQVERSYYYQMLTYAALLSGVSSKSEITCYIADIPRYQVKDPFVFTKKMIIDFEDEVIQRVRDLLADKMPYEVGDHCHFCNIRHECKAHSAKLTNSLEALMTVETPMPNFATIEAAGRLDEFYDRLKMVKQACDAMTKGLALHVNIRNGELATTGGMFKLINIEKKTLDPVKSWDTIAEHLSTTEIAECTSISLPKVLKAVGKKAEPGQGVKVKKALTDQLDAAGAIQWSGYTKMDYRKTVKNKQE